MNKGKELSVAREVEICRAGLRNAKTRRDRAHYGTAKHALESEIVRQLKRRLAQAFQVRDHWHPKRTEPQSTRNDTTKDRNMKEYFMIQYELSDKGCGVFGIDADDADAALKKAPDLIREATGQTPARLKFVGMAGPDNDPRHRHDNR